MDGKPDVLASHPMEIFGPFQPICKIRRLELSFVVVAYCFGTSTGLSLLATIDGASGGPKNSNAFAARRILP